jgi:hypothetical protein
MNFNLVWGKGFDHLNQESLGFPELNLKRNPQLKTLFPNRKKSSLAAVPQNGGFISTQQGPVMFSATELRHSDRSGTPIGVLIFVRKVRPGLIKSLQMISQLSLFSHIINNKIKLTNIPRLGESPHNEPFSFKRQRVIENPAGKPIILFNIEHKHTLQPRLFDRTVSFTLALLALIPLSMLLLVNNYLIRPFAYSAQHIRHMTNTGHYQPINTTHKITEVKGLSDNFNELINTINQQKMNCTY